MRFRQRHPNKKSPRRSVRPRLEALEERLAPDGGGVTALPHQFRQLMAWGNAIRSQEDLLQFPEFLSPDHSNAPAAPNTAPGSNFGSEFVFGPAEGPTDPGALGPFIVTTRDYNFGDQRFDPVSIAGTARVELTARIWAPQDLSAGPRPVLVFMHGNHAATYNPTSGAAGFSWPPPAGFQSLPNHMGYGSNPFNPGVTYVGDLLASHGYIVISVSANGVNVLGGTNMVPRAELMHRHLQVLRDLSTTGTVTGDGIVDDPGTPQDETRPFGNLFVGKMDLTNIGTMGHSRGGDGVVAHFQYETGVNLGSGLPVLPPAERFPIKAVLPLAPVDFAARTINNVPLLVMLPYNDGDVSDLQGQRFYDRSRYNVAGDNSSHHVVTVLGANHNSYNSIWFAEPSARFTPGSGDDGAAAGNPRLTPQQVRSTAMAYFGAFFRTYVGNAVVPTQTMFFSLLTGDAALPPSVITPTDPVLAGGIFQEFHPADNVNARRDVNRLLNAAALTTNQLGAAVTSSGVTAAFSTAGLQAVGSARLTWTTPGGFWQNAIPAGSAADVARYSHLQFRVHNFSATALVNFSVVLTDGAGNSATTTVNAHYTNRRTPLSAMPPTNPGGTTPRHRVLNTAAIPMSAFSSINLSDVRSIRFVFNQSTSGDILVTDLMFAEHVVGFQVASTNPGAGSTVSTPPTVFTVTFSDAYNPATLNASDLQVNGIPADSVVATSPTVATFTYATSPVTVQGMQTISIAAGALTRASDGEPLGGFTTNFRFDVAPLTVVATTPPVGSTILLPFTQLDVSFSEPIDPASADIGDLTLSQGTVIAANVLSPTQVRYTLAGITTEGALTVQIAAGALTDEFTNPGQAFTGNYTLDIGTVPFADVRAESPAGSLIHTTSAAGVVAPAADRDSFTINVNANQTITVVVRPTSATLRPAVELRDAGGSLVGSAIAPAANQVAYIQAVPSGSGGVFTVSVSGAAGTTGSYSVQLILNAAVEDERFGGPNNDTSATAQGLAPAFLNLTSSAQRAAVFGQTSGTSTTHPIWAGIVNPVGLTGDGGLGTSTIGMRAAGTGQAIGRFPNGDDAVIVGNNGRTLLSVMPYLITNAAQRVPFAQNEISFLLAGLTSPRVLYFSDVSPAGADPYLQALTALGITPTVVPQSSTGAPDTYPQFVTQLSTGNFDLVIFQQRFWSSDTVVTPMVNHINNGRRFLWTTWNRSQTFAFMTPVFTAFGATTTGGVNQLSVNQLGAFTVLPDYYSFSLAAGQRVTLALQTAGSATLDLRGPTDTSLALGRPGATNLTQVISDFVATQAGTYYARVTGAQLGVDYTLIVTRNSEFDTESNNDFLSRAAQPLGPAVNGVQTALGNAIGAGGSPAGARVLYFSDVSPAGADPYQQAFAALGITPTIVPQSSTGAPDTYPQFVTQLTTGTWDLVVFQQRFWSSDTVVTPMVNYINGGGRAIWSSWNRTQTFAFMAPVFAAFGANTSAVVNQTVLTQVDSTLWTGLPNPLTFTLDGGLGTSSTGFSLTTGASLGRWANNDVAVVSANDGRTLLTGYMPYLVTGGVAATLAQNEISFVLGGVSDTDVYQARATEGTVLRVTTATPLTGPGQPGNTLDPVIRLYGPDGTLVAEDDNSGADGVNASLVYTVPAGGTGMYFFEVGASAATPAPTRGQYILNVEGGTNGLPAFEVTATTPRDRVSLNVAPTTMTVTFNTNFLLTSLAAGDLTVDGRPATAFTVLDGSRVQFTLPTGLGEGIHFVDIAAGAVTSTDGTALTAYTGTFFLDTIGPRVVASSVQEGGIQAPGTLSYVVRFDELLEASVLDAADFTLRGVGRAVNYTPTGFNYDVTTSTLTINYAGLPEDNYTLTLLSAATALRDVTGNLLDGETVVGGVPVWPIPPGRSGNGVAGGNFVVNFIVDAGVTTFPGPLNPVLPLGSLIHRGEVSAFIAPAADTDSFTLAVDGGGQTIAVVVTPAAGLRPIVDLLDPSGTVIASATAPAAGQPAVLQAAPAAVAGIYTVRVRGAAGTGLYTARVTLNAALEAESNGGPTNNTRGTAQAVTGFTALLKGADRAAILGRTDQGASYSATAVTPTFEDIRATGTILANLQGQDDATQQITTAQLSGFTFPFFGTTFNTLFVSSNGLITFGSGFAGFTNTDLTTTPAQATIAAYWDDLFIPSSAATGSVRFQVLGSGATQRLVVQWTNVEFLGSGVPTLTFQMVLNANGSIQFNYLNLVGGDPFADDGRSATAGIKAAGTQGPNRLLLHFNQPPSTFLGSNRSTLINPPGAPTSDFYAVTLGAGQAVSLGLAALSGGALTLELQDGAGTVLATGQTAANLARVINNFRVTTAGTYFINVGGAANLDYSLVVTRDADFDTEANNSFATAQNITGVVGSLGHVAAGGSTTGARVLYFSDVSPAGADPYLQALSGLGITPTIVPQSSTGAPDTYPQFVTQLTTGTWDLVVFQQRFWSSDTIVTPMVNYINGGGRAIWSSWNRTQTFAFMAPVFAAFGANTSAVTNQTVLTQVTSPVWTGLPNPLTFTLDGGLGTSSTGFSLTTGTALGRWANNDAAVVLGASGRTLLTGYMPYLVTGGLATNLARNEISFVLGGITDEDWYRVDATAGQTLEFFTITPADGTGEFQNTLDAHIELYGPGGNLIATGTPEPDGRNERITFTVPAGGAGIYRIRVTGENGTSGTYFLDPIAVEAAGPASMPPAGMLSGSAVAVSGTDGAGLVSFPTSVVTFDTAPLPGVAQDAQLLDRWSAFAADGLGLSQLRSAVSVSEESQQGSRSAEADLQLPDASARWAADVAGYLLQVDDGLHEELLDQLFAGDLGTGGLAEWLAEDGEGIDGGW